MEKIKNLGYAVKLDTNGYRPEVLKSVIDAGLVDYVAMDIKNCRERYAATAGLPTLDISKIERSADILMRGSLPFEFRTTTLKEYHDRESFEKIGQWLAGRERYFIQGFAASDDLISDGLDGYNKNELTDLLNVLTPYIPNAQLRG